MLGGGDEDDEDLQELILACRNQVEGPLVRLQGGNHSVQEQETAGEGSQSGQSQGQAIQSLDHRPSTWFMDPTIRALLDQNNRLMEMVRSKGEESTKRKVKEEVSYATQEPVMLFFEAYKIEDDAHDKIDTFLRQSLRPINVDPATYWTKEAFKRVDRPIRGSALYLEHIMQVHVNEITICKSYDRCAILEIKNYLTKNSGVGTNLKKRCKIYDIEEDEFNLGVHTQWSKADTVFEVVDAGFNYLCVEFMIRNYSYTAIAIIRCLHECRYFCGVASCPKQQRTLIESYFNECLKVKLNSACISSKLHID